MRPAILGACKGHGTPGQAGSYVIVGSYRFPVGHMRLAPPTVDLHMNPAASAENPDALPVFVVLTSPDGQLQYANDALCSVLGIDPEVGPGGERRVPSLLATLVGPAFTRLAGEPLVRLHTSTFETGRGAELSVAWHSRPIRNADGLVTHIESVGVETPTQTRCDPPFSASRLRVGPSPVALAEAMEHAADHVAIMDPDGRLEYVNAAFETLTGRSRECLVGFHIEEVWGGTLDRKETQEALATLGRGDVHRGERVNRNAAGELFFDEFVISPLQDGSGRTTHLVAVGRDATSRHLTDPLTGLHSRRMMVERIRLATKRPARRPMAQSALLFLDVDRFKSVNDTHGKQIGDEVILELANRIQLAVREVDAVGHVGHLNRDEFVILLEELHAPAEAARVAEIINDHVRQPIQTANGEVVVTASIGIAYGWSDTASAEEVIRNAETAMMRAKRVEVGSQRFFEPMLHERVVQMHRLGAELRRALQNNELILHYQPIVDLRTGSIASAEALVRWNHPERGMVPPMDFIQAAEENGLIVPLGLEVMRKACRQIRAWRDSGMSPLSISVNVSARQFRDAHFVDLVHASLVESSLEPRALKLELTESTAADDPESVIRTLGLLKDMGVQLLLDDFGTGYSSLSYLTRLPIDKLKIDRSFVCNVPGSTHDASVTTTIVAMAKSLDYGVVAEGVETAEQLSFLVALGCDEMQGYLFSKPVPAEEFERMVRSGTKFDVTPDVS